MASLPQRLGQVFRRRRAVRLPSACPVGTTRNACRGDVQSDATAAPPSRDRRNRSATSPGPERLPVVADEETQVPGRGRRAVHRATLRDVPHLEPPPGVAAEAVLAMFMTVVEHGVHHLELGGFETVRGQVLLEPVAERLEFVDLGGELDAPSSGAGAGEQCAGVDRLVGVADPPAPCPRTRRRASSRRRARSRRPPISPARDASR